ncbi:MAG: CocE/NonD family hydrolase [Armatimonadota bacterium]|nr:CocE/NonD family hydrolase [Armatimonadota bacterium]
MSKRDITDKTQAYAKFLWLLLGLFILRVLGQIAVVVWKPSFLPPMEEWMSGAIKYPSLLTSQILIIALLGTVCLQFTRGEGWFTRPSRKIGRFLMWFGSIYLSVMVIRYVVRMSLYPEERWTGLSIPIFFHWILASFVLAVALYHLRNSAPARRRLFLRFGGIFVVAATLVVWIGYLIAPAILGQNLGFGPPLYAARVERAVALRTSDGIELVADVYRPRRAGRVPTILVRLPIAKTPVNSLAATVVGRMWAEHGYNVVIQGVRGRYQSGGIFYPLVSERSDGIETLRWLEQQPWFDGRLGMWGGSYFGYTQWVLTDQVDPERSAFLIQIASTSFYDMFYPGGALSLESALYWGLFSGGGEKEAISGDDLDRGYGSLPLIESDDRAGMDVNFFNDWVSHTTRDDYWRSIDGNSRWKQMRSPALFMAGWFDPFLPSQLEDFMRIRAEAPESVAANTHLVIGPWAHAYSPRLPGSEAAGNYRLDSLAPSIPWFDRRLKGKRTSEIPPVRIFVMGKNIWRDEQEWPLARTVYTPYYLWEGKLEREASPRRAETKYEHDPRNPVRSQGGAMLGPRAGPRQQDLTARPDVLVFGTETLGEEVEITGPLRAILYVTTDAPNTDFVVTMMDVHPNGRAYKISEGILRQPYPADAKGPVRIELSMWPTSIVIGKGHSLRVHVSSSSYPRFDVNPNTVGDIATGTTSAIARQALFCGRGSASRIILPVIPKH